MRFMLIPVMWDSPEDGGPNEYYTSAPDTEDEKDLSIGLHGAPRLFVKQPSKPEECPTSKALAKSYAKLEKAVPLGHKPDKWHGWFEMQAEWMKNIEKDPEHYFDDYL